MTIQELIKLAEDDRNSNDFVGISLRECLDELKDMAEEQVEGWWLTFDRSSIHRLKDDWIVPYTKDSEYAAKRLHGLGELERHPDSSYLYRRKKQRPGGQISGT